MTLKPPGPHMEATARVKAIVEIFDVTVNPDTHPKHYLRSGRELIRTAASYQEDGQTEQAYILYIRFLTIFLDKLRHHPNYKEVPSSERKLMSDYCQKVFPHAESLKKDLLKKYEKEHEEYSAQVERLKKLAEERQREEEERMKAEAERRAKDPTKTIDPHSVFKPVYNEGGYLPSGSGVTRAQINAPFPDNDLKLDVTQDPNAKPLVTPEPSPQLPSTSLGPPSMPSVDRSTKPSRVLTPMSTGIRPLIIPISTSEMFLRHATSNTKRNVETCGLLTGKIRGKQLIITDLIIPKQTGSSDTCNMMSETEIFDLQDKYNLITLGWIHTHPSQTAFLSSIDLHTHYSYQIMMPEAIAIVCAPSHKEVGFFTLTQLGMDEIGRCNQSGFHPHSSAGVFSEASHYTLEQAELKVHDLR